MLDDEEVYDRISDFFDTQIAPTLRENGKFCLKDYDFHCNEILLEYGNRGLKMFRRLAYIADRVTVPSASTTYHYHGPTSVNNSDNSTTVHNQGGQIGPGVAFGPNSNSEINNSMVEASQKIQNSTLDNSVKDLLSQAIEQIKSSPITDNEKEDATGYIETIGKELTKDKPDEGRLKRAARSLNEVCSAAAAAIRTIPTIERLWASIVG